MFSVSVTSFWLMVVGICGRCSELGSLVRRIHEDVNIGTVYCIGIREGHLNEILKNNFDVPRVVFTYFPRILEIPELFDENVVIVLEVDRSRSENLNNEEFTIVLRVRKFILIIADSFEVLGECFQYFHGEKFTRIFGIAGDIPYAYLPYADRSIQVLGKDDPIPDALRNFNGFSLRTTVQSDIPRVFWYKDTQGHSQIGGYVGQLFLNFLRRRNASFTEILINNSSKLNTPGVLDAITNDEIDISMNTYCTVEGYGMSYPIYLLHWTIVTPVNGFVESQEYFIRPFTGLVWLLIGLVYIYIVVMDILKDFYADVPIDLWFYLRRTFLKFLSMPSETRITSARRFHCQVLLFAFVLSNFYFVYLTSFLTVFIKVEQYDTVRDLIDHKVPVMMIDYELGSISDPEHRFDGIEDILVLADYDVVSKGWYSLKNRGVSYTMGTDRASFLVNLQMKFTQPSFHTIRESLLDYYLVFLLDTDSPFKEILDEFIIDVADTGLMEKWENDAIAQGLQAGLEIERPPRHGLLVPLTLHHLRFAWNCLGMGFTFAFFAFVGELYSGVMQYLFLKKW